MIDKLLKRLPSNYKKGPDTQTYKMLKLAADQFENGDKTITKIKNWRDIDQAKGVVLDRIGNDVGQAREGLNDELYRQKIKIKIRSNLSGGDIETLNDLFASIYGEHFKGIEEGWSHVIAEPASVVVEVSEFAGSVDKDIVKGITAGGVKIHLATEAKGDTISLVGKSYSYDVPLPITEMFSTEGVQGIKIGEPVNMKYIAYGFAVPFPICGEFYSVL